MPGRSQSINAEIKPLIALGVDLPSLLARSLLRFNEYLHCHAFEQWQSLMCLKEKNTMSFDELTILTESCRLSCSPWHRQMNR